MEGSSSYFAEKDSRKYESMAMYNYNDDNLGEDFEDAEGNSSPPITMTFSDEDEPEHATSYSAGPCLNFSGQDLCSSDPSRLYSLQGSGGSLRNSSLDRSIGLLMQSRDEADRNQDGNVLLKKLDSLSEEDARLLLSRLGQASAKELLIKMVRGDVLSTIIRRELALADDPAHCPWNERFQALLDLPDGPAKYAALSNLGNDFVHAATSFGRLIIEELFIETKTIKPLSMGGVHGGFKYCVHGILFKFALASDATKDLFGGSDANAMKTAGHELKSLVSIFNAGVSELRLPLMCIIDYRGFRILAVSVLPISANTLRYGSSNGGRTVHDDDVRLTIAMKKLAGVLGLKRHRVGEQNLYVCGDVEGHRGTDGRLYLVDLARLFPPEFPSEPHMRNDIWFKLLRCEAVRAFQKPLSSDALSAWGSAGARQNNAEVRAASVWLRESLVPQCAMAIDEAVKSGNASNPTFRVRTVLHQMGINCRHLGLVRKWCVLETSRKLLQNEIIARTIKCFVNFNLRNMMATLRLPVDQPYRHMLVGIMNIVLGNDNGEKSRSFWTVELRDMILVKFGRATFSDEEMEEGYDLRRTVSGIVELIRRILGFLGVVLTKKAQQELLADPRTFEFVDPDIATWNPKVKHASFIDQATGFMLMSHGDSLTAAGDTNEAIRMYDGADASFKRAVSNCATGVQVYEAWADVSLKLADLWAQRASAEGVTNARLHFDKAAFAWLQAIRLQSIHVPDAWDVASNLHIKANATEGTRRQLYLYGAFQLYRSLSENDILRASANFLFEYGDVCRAASVDDVGIRISSTELVQLAARSWEEAFALDQEKRFQVWDSVVHTDPTKSDREFLASLIMIAEHSHVLYDDLIQAFYNQQKCDLSGVAALSENALVNLFSDRNFNVVRLSLSGCLQLTGQVFISLSTSCEFLMELHMAKTRIDDSDVRFLAKRCRLLEVIDFSDCARVTDASLNFLASLPFLKALYLRSCDLSDRGLFEVLVPNNNIFNKDCFLSLTLLDLSHVPRLTYGAVYRMRQVKKLERLIHTSRPMFLSREKFPDAAAHLSEDGVVTWKLDEAYMLRSNAVIPLEEENFYFEVQVLDGGKDGAIGIGIAPRGISMSGLPGWYSGSLGYHGDDGAVFSGNNIGNGRDWGPVWGKGDVVGLGLWKHDDKMVVFFTKNGKLIGFPFKDVPVDSYYPVVGCISPGAKFRCIFNLDECRFDVEAELKLWKGDWTRCYLWNTFDEDADDSL